MRNARTTDSGHISNASIVRSEVTLDCAACSQLHGETLAGKTHERPGDGSAPALQPNGRRTSRSDRRVTNPALWCYMYSCVVTRAVHESRSARRIET